MLGKIFVYHVAITLFSLFSIGQEYCVEEHSDNTCEFEGIPKITFVKVHGTPVYVEVDSLGMSTCVLGDIC